MRYFKLHSYEYPLGVPQTTITETDASDPAGTGFNVLSSDELEIVNGAIQLRTAPKPEVIAKQQQLMRDACQAAIEVGFASVTVLSATGAAYTYPTSKQDQQNLEGVVQASVLYGAALEPYHFWAADAQGNWARRAHTAAEIQAVGKEVYIHVRDQQAHYELKLGEIALCSSNAQVEGVVW